MEKLNLYKQHNAPIELAFATSGKLINNPMYNRDVKLYKGILNKIEFSVKNQDRKIISMEDKTLKMFIHNLDHTESTVIPLDIKDINWGKYEARINEEMLEMFDNGFYYAYIVAYNQDNEEQILYTGANWETRFEVEIIGGIYDTFEPSQEIRVDNLLYQTYKEDNASISPFYLSSLIKANKSYYHGFQFNFNGYNGSITILGSNDLDISDNIKDWFEINTFEVLPETKIIGKTLECSCQWIRIKFNPVEDINSKITKILYRN